MITLIAEPRAMLYQLEFVTPDDLEWHCITWNRNQHQPEIYARTAWELRGTSHDVSHTPKLAEFVTELMLAQMQLFARLWNTREFQQMWGGYTWEQLCNNTEPYYELCQDQPGFDTGIHVDHRKAVTAGMVFFNQSNELTTSTVFYDNDRGHHSLAMPCAHGQGWYSANSHNMWHSGANNSQHVRLSIKFGLQLKMVL